MTATSAPGDRAAVASFTVPPIRRLDFAAADFDATLTRLTAFDAVRDPAVSETVAAIIADVRARGDAAVVEYTRRFDRREVSDIAELRLGVAQLDAALAGLPADQRAALEQAAERVRRFHERQRQPSWTYTEADGTRLGQRTTAIDRVGLYVPGGKAAYPSSVLMNAMPATVAGVASRAMVVPTPEGVLNQMVLAAARLGGVDEVWTIGGAQAVAALAHGTESIRAVDKIVGPGNAWVAEAKRQVYGEVGIDMIAGPSEILIIADGSVPADWVAMDLFSQAEHDEMAQAILISPEAAYLDRVAESIARQLPGQPRRDIIARSLADRGALILVPDLARGCEVVNRIAPEHLELAVADPQALFAWIRHAGAIFCGSHSSESLGDYCAGPSHVLPTMRTPRFASPLGVYDFQKRSSIIEVSPAGASRLGPIAATLARTESLEAHARSAEYRIGTGAVAGNGDAAEGAAAGATAGLGAGNAGPPAEAAGRGFVPRLQKLASRITGAALSSEAAGRVALPVAGSVDPLAAAVDEAIGRVVRDEVRAMQGYQVPPSAGFIKLDAMENPFRLPPTLATELGERLGAVAINRYPSPDYAELKAQLAEAFVLPVGAGIVLGNGSDELIAMLCALVARPGATILSPAPSFVMYAMSAQQYGLRHVGVPLAADFSLDRAAMLTAIDNEQPALIFLAWPNNPTGNAFDRETVEAVIARAPGLVVIDEAYEPFAQATWVGDLAHHPNVVVLRTLSKWGLAGLRLGFLVAAPAWAEQLEKLRPPYNVGVLNEAAARFALEHVEVFAEQAAVIRDERAWLVGQLTALAARPGSSVTRVYPSEANFVLIRIDGAAGAGTAVAGRLRDAGVLIKDASRIHPSLENCLRLTVGTPDENRALIDALVQAAVR